MWPGKRLPTPLSMLTLFSTISLVQFDPCLSHDTKIYSLKLRTSPEPSNVVDGDVKLRRRRSVNPSGSENVVGWSFAKDNLRGRAGQGYYIEMEIGTPKQQVSHYF